jgi:hypothetical protein
MVHLLSRRIISVRHGRTMMLVKENAAHEGRRFGLLLGW